MPADASQRVAWVSYLRVSTHGQAERELSIPAQRAAIEEYAARHGAQIAREYIETGSGRESHRPQFRRMVGDALASGSDVAAIVVHHTSRFTRDSTEARLVKRRLRKAGVHVVSVSQELGEDVSGRLVEGILECVDQYESEINGARTSAAMRESIRQGFYPGARAPFGYATVPVEIRPGVLRHKLVPDPAEAAIVREMFALYVASHGALAVARSLNERGLLHRGRPWSKTTVLNALGDSAVIGTVHWGRHATRDRVVRPSSEWQALHVEPIVDRATFDLAQQLRTTRDSRERRNATAPVHVLGGLIRCGQCGASYQLESSGKRIDGGVYRYCYYNCRRSCREGKEACAGFRIPSRELDAAVLGRIADVVCTRDRAHALRRAIGRPTLDVDGVIVAWRNAITTDAHVGTTYVRRLVARVVVHANRIVLEPRPPTESENAPP